MYIKSVPTRWYCFRVATKRDSVNPINVFHQVCWATEIANPGTGLLISTAELTLIEVAVLIYFTNTETTPMAGSLEDTVTATPAMVMTVAAASLAEMTIPAILRASSFWPTLQVHGSSV
eukprot:jgi/Phyca11/102592/e_gw1.7.565.1